MVLSVFRVEHAIVVVEFYAIVFPLCKYISTPKSDRKSHWLWTISNHPTKIALILNSDNQKLWRKIERLSDSKIVIGRSAFIDLIVWRVIPIPCDTIFQPRYCTRMWSCHPVCARNGTNPWICACKGWHGIACRYDDVPRSKIEGLPDRAPEIIKVASIPLRVYIACIPFDFIVIKWQIDICVARFNLSSCSIASNYCFSIYKWRPYKCSG